MTIPAYSQLYLHKSSRTVGTMLHDAVEEFGMDGAEFLHMFVQSGIAGQIEDGNPKYIAGKSGLELFLDVMEITTGQYLSAGVIENYERSEAYWAGWMLTHYQWYSGRSFRSILAAVPYDEIIGLYGILHEADISKSYEVLDAHCSASVSALKAARKSCGMTQRELAAKSGVPVNTIRAYERKSKDLRKARVDTVMRLAGALKCNLSDLLD